VIDQSAVGVSSRSNPGTYAGIMDDVRKAFVWLHAEQAIT
jgi:excinuclease UvrABC ATPase subunit